MHKFSKKISSWMPAFRRFSSEAPDAEAIATRTEPGLYTILSDYGYFAQYELSVLAKIPADYQARLAQKIGVKPENLPTLYKVQEVGKIGYYVAHKGRIIHKTQRT